LRSSLADTAFAIEDRLVWGGADLLRGAFDILRWPFERLVWAIERGLVWPLEERTGTWSRGLRSGGVVALALLAAGAGVLGLVWASGSGGSRPAVTQAPPRAVTPVATEVPAENLAPAAPVLHGATPDFTPEDSVGGAQAVGGTGGGNPEAKAASTPATEEAAATASSAQATEATAKIVAVGPAATSVAHRFAGAFVDFETGQVDAEVRSAFAATATPQLTRSLLRRPPRLPANVKVPRAKVLNVVPGPRHGDTYTISVSLLRLGVTSELRIDMELDPQSDEWKVTDVLG
jgi:hypothetical protein